MKRAWLAALGLAAALAGCVAIHGPGIALDPKRAGERIVVVAAVAEGSVTKKSVKERLTRMKEEYRGITGRPFPPDMELVSASEAFDNFGGDRGHAFIVPVPKAWAVETGDYLEIVHPGENEYAKAVRIVNKWNDPAPGGCYWEGAYSRAWSGRVVCKDHAPEAPERRRGYRDTYLPYHAGQEEASSSPAR